MSYRFVAAANDYGPRKGPAAGFLIHMAEGGGTVAFLAGSPARGVSVHYVIERSGRIVQMLLEAHASGSVDPTKIRRTDDPDGLFGATAAQAVLGTWANDPNSAVISVEVEGFAAEGPNDDQVRALVELVDDVRARHPGIGLLGHRDFADYKACPGRRIPWSLIGGHGAQEESMGLHVTLPAIPLVGSLAIPLGTDTIRVADGSHYRVPKATTRPAYTAALTAGTSGAGYLVDLDGDELHFVRVNAGATFTPPPPPVVDCDDVVDAELEHAAERAATAVRTRP